jgi:hypothetical protein
MTIPPTWLPLDKLKEIYGERAESWTVAVAVELPYTPLVERILDAYRAHDRAGIPFPSDKLHSAGDVTHHIFCKMGDLWTISYKGWTIYLKEAKGLHYLAFLLQHPGQEWPVMEIIRQFGKPQIDSIGQIYSRIGAMQLEAEHLTCSNLGDAGEMLDSQAVADYRRRLNDLQKELKEAQQCNNLARASEVREEMDFIARELAVALGLGGRNRRAKSPAERARLSVTKAIKATLQKISETHPDLGRYLSTHIRTGSFCSYNPDPNDSISWSF